jgi:hypothetical protein
VQYQSKDTDLSLGTPFSPSLLHCILLIHPIHPSMRNTLNTYTQNQTQKFTEGKENREEIAFMLQVFKKGLS